MKKVLFSLITGSILLLMAIPANTRTSVACESDAQNKQTDDFVNSALIDKLLSIQVQLKKSDEQIFYLHIDVVKSTMTVFRLVQEDDLTFSLEEMSSHFVGTPKSRIYPKGFGYIYARERNPIWAPTKETVRLFKKRGVNLEKFRNKQGKIIIPAGDRLNYMGPIKMRVKFLEKQTDAKLIRDVYRIHGTLKKDERKLGTRCSGGCIRTQNEELIKLNEKTKGGLIIVQYV